MAAKPRFDPPLLVGMVFSLLSAVVSRPRNARFQWQFIMLTWIRERLFSDINSVRLRNFNRTDEFTRVLAILSIEQGR